MRPVLRDFLLTGAALLGFAANSLLTRAALDADDIDAASFAAMRLVAGAVALALLMAGRGRRAREGGPPPPKASARLAEARGGGSWPSAAALAGYALLFTWAYERIGASVGALVLFGAVQLTMIGWGLWRGERPTAVAWAGWLLALLGLVLLTAPGLTAPDRMGTMLMALAGFAWGAYSLRGRAAADPLATTAANFTRGSILTLAASMAAFSAAHVSPRGLLFAVLSGSLTSGVAYALWYAVLPRLTAWRAAIVQLSVPVLTGVGAWLVLGERLTVRLLAAGAVILFGVLLSMHAVNRDER
jgi:drug/metabolite transporter (DMT)-like permease